MSALDSSISILVGVPTFNIVNQEVLNHHAVSKNHHFEIEEYLCSTVLQTFSRTLSGF